MHTRWEILFKSDLYAAVRFMLDFFFFTLCWYYNKNTWKWSRTQDNSLSHCSLLSCRSFILAFSGPLWAACWIAGMQKAQGCGTPVALLLCRTWGRLPAVPPVKMSFPPDAPPSRWAVILAGVASSGCCCCPQGPDPPQLPVLQPRPLFLQQT